MRYSKRKPDYLNIELCQNTTKGMVATEIEYTMTKTGF